MNKIGNGLLIALAISWSSLVFSGQEDEQTAADTAAASAPAEQAAPASAEGEAAEKTAEQAKEQALPSGIGWKLIRRIEMGNSGKFVQMVLIEKGRQADKTVYSAAIHKLCSEEKEFCRLRFWVQPYLIPEKVTLTLEQQKGQQADHLFNRAAGVHRTLWACTIDPTSESCIQ
ncbi:hypothetical protein [Nitrosomonas sp.]|uniref:hypothetical protein n=1 Tax=Nitrosomonas sp. TaxID=42353 RepID=UPI0025F43303|nr:hypothetical protein [Nitrosomonas sp.]MCC6916405.1 hypothetical protein [Nitrosomonas sp.]